MFVDYAELPVIMFNIGSIVALENVEFVYPDQFDYVAALNLMQTYGLTSIFDAIYASITLRKIKDHTIISTDTSYDRVRGIERVDPRELAAKY
mgnify:CR=1 FL=1